jgi:hypothetical protein
VDPAAALFGRLDALNREVNGLLNDPNVRRMALEVGIVLLAKKYPALSVLLGAFGDTGVKQTTAGRTAIRKPAPVKQRHRIK